MLQIKLLVRLLAAIISFFPAYLQCFRSVFANVRPGALNFCFFAPNPLLFRPNPEIKVRINALMFSPPKLSF